MRPKPFTIAIIFLTLSALSCTKSKTATSFRGKVIGILCGQVAVDIEGDNGIGTTFTDANITYKNAVQVLPYCSVVNANVQVGNTIAFNITTNPPTTAPTCGNGAQCMALYGPGKSVYITDITIVTP